MQPPNRTILQVSELNAEVSLLLNRGFPLLWVEGEISNLSRPASAHLYFSLKDAKAHIRCAMFRNKAIHLDLQPENGMKVLVRGRIGLYEPRGDFQLIVEHMEEAGAGLLQKQFEELKKKLSAKGWFDETKKQALPIFPKQIGIISSPAGAALHDILNVLKRRCPQIPILVYPSVVQGAQAALQLETAVRQANISKTCDVLILSRGGGSTEDLIAFNNENLARAIYESEIPIISGVGHEIDFTIADFVADKRAPTPSIAAELVSPDIKQLTHHLIELKQKLSKTAHHNIEQKKQIFSWHKRRLEQQKPSHKLQQQAQRLNALEQRLTQRIQHIFEGKRHLIASLEKQLQATSPNRILQNKQQTLQQQQKLLLSAIQKKITAKHTFLAVQLAKLDAISPLKTLERGYAIIRDENKKNITNPIKQINTGDTINIRVINGEIISKIILINPIK